MFSNNMDGKLKPQGRRCRAKRERVRRLREPGSREARSPDPNSSCSDREGHGPGRDAASLAGKKAPRPAAATTRAPRPPRRKRRESSSQEEDIIDGFAITSFTSLDRLEKKSGVMKTQEKKERWKEKKAVKRQKNEDEDKEEENVQPVLDPLENGFLHHAQREQERMNERLLKRTYSKKNKMIKPLALCPVKVSIDDTLQELGRPHRSNSKERLSESSTHSLSGHGYSVLPAAVALLKVSDVGSEKLFSPTTPKGVPTNESPESRTCSSAKVSGLQRSQEQSNTEVPFAPPVPSPTPASAPTGSPAPAAAAAPPEPRGSRLPTPPLGVKKEQPPPPPPVPTPPLLKAPPHLQLHPPHPHALQDPRVLPPPPHHARPVISHQVHHPLQYGLHDLSHRSSPVGLTRQHLPTSPHHHLSGLPSSAPSLPLSIANLSTSHYSSLRSPAHRHSAMFATPATLPPPPTLPTNSLVVPGHPAGTPYPEHDLLRQELNNRFLVQSSERGRGPPASPLAPVSLLRAEFHQHQHMHQHQHTHQHTFTPFPASLPPAAILTPPTAPPMVRTQARNFDKYTPKLDNPFIRHSNFFPSYPPTMPGMPPLLPHSGPFSSLQGAFQPKASNPIDVAARPGAVPHTLLQKDPRMSDPFRTSVRKPGKWCAVHVQIAWQIYHHQQKMKQMQLDPHKLDMNGKLDLFSRPPAPGVFPGFPYPHDLARPLFPSTGSGHPAPSPFGPAPHPSGFLPPSHLAGKYPFSRSSSFGGLGNLSSSAFGGLGNPSLGSSSVFGSKEGPGGLPTFGSPHHDTWNRLRRTPPSFPTPPQWPKTADTERSGSANSHDREREREREREKRDSSIGKEEKDKDRDSVDRNRHSNRSSPASAPVSYQISSLIRSNSQNSNDSGRHHSGSVDRVREAEKELLERQRESSMQADVKVKESRSPGKEMLERRPSEDSIKPAQRSPSPYSKALISEQGLKMAGGLPSSLKDIERKEPTPTDFLHKVKNDMKIKEERKEEQEVMVVSSEPAPQPPPHTLPVPISQPGNPHHNHPPLSQQPPLPSPRSSDIPAPGLHGVPMAHSLPLSMSGMPQMGSLNVLDRARMAPFMGVSPLAGRERLPPSAFPWDPLREAYRSLDLQRRMDFQLRAEQGHRFPPSVYEQERAYREREAHDYSHHEHLLEVRREHERMRQQAEERERLHLREELDRARLHQLHQSPMEGHLPHMPPFMPHLGGMPYPRLSPSTGHNGPLNRTPPTAALSAPPPLVPAGSARPASPRRTTPLTTTQDPRDYSPSRNPKEVEAR
ncbi:autism susceptibility gene 2 protein isoform X5 [Austrofundulus limnaeus]|uniref:Autism susceptibility gene 2 protein isoform X5 n=1 Tax=Austrofundulus limnaeus TaxID=52670 RepID=A0A2I4C2E6_AUSLI|nr:PREDICTED: autism susceptibility gene 2 protein-like isoform X5 [Austrofundulus limnaeus]